MGIITMALVKIKDYYPDYRDTVGDDDIKNFDVYAGRDEKIGSVDDILVDETSGRFRYLIVNTGMGGLGKSVLLPIGRATIDHDDRRIYAQGLTKEQVENLPKFSDDLKIDNDYEERVRGVYRPTTTATSTATATPSPDYGTYDREAYNYDREPALYGMNEQDHQTLRLYEERLIANKHRQKAGEVVVGKRVETEAARVSVPVEKERVVIERTTPDTIHPVDADNVDFREGEVARMEVYEESPDIRKEAFVREEVNVRKVVDRNTVDAEETLRREELDIDPGNTRL